MRPKGKSNKCTKKDILKGTKRNVLFHKHLNKAEVLRTDETNNWGQHYVISSFTNNMRSYLSRIWSSHTDIFTLPHFTLRK